MKTVSNTGSNSTQTDSAERICLNAGPSTLGSIRSRVRGILSEKELPEEIDVILSEGVYSPKDFIFGKEDCSEKVRVVYSGPKGAVLHGGITVKKENWLNPDDEMSARFSPEALPHIRMISLKDLGMTREDWGEEAVIGGFNTANKYDDAPKGFGSEFFCGFSGEGSSKSKRMIKARYPNYGQYGKLESVPDAGDAWEFPPQNYHYDWLNRRNHRGGCYIIDEAANERVKNWKDPSTAWMFGYFYWDWADASTPVTVNPSCREVFPKFVANYGARAGALYYFYNIPEELDSEGEWYLDRDTGRLYFWPWDGADYADFSCFGKPLISCSDTENLTFSGFTLQCGVAGAVSAKGKNLRFDNLLIKNIGQNAVSVEGTDNCIKNCELAYLGRGGIILSGGERERLIHGSNIAENNYIHNFAELYQTNAPGISICGVGNIAAHNEICESPHMAILYSGNEHLIEYNDIHDVVKMSADAAAIYSGRDSIAYGTVIRYNRIRNVGSGDFRPHGIYWDDALNGQTAFGNILIDVGCWGFEIGGGRCHRVVNNLIVRSGDAALEYDDRLRDGIVNNGWYVQGTRLHIEQLSSSPRLEEPWASAYPELAAVNIESEYDPDDVNSFMNPSHSVVKNNIAISCGKLYAVAESVFRFSAVSDNFIYEDTETAGWNESSETLKPDSIIFREHPDFEPVPRGQIGRISADKA